MQITATTIPDLYVIELQPQWDERGFFARAWCRTELASRGLPAECVEASLAYNVRRGTLRGLHYQSGPDAEAKYVRVIRGAVHDVVLDLRQNSPTLGNWFACELSDQSRRALFVPPGCAHGYLTLSDDAELLYLISSVYRPEAAGGVHWAAPALSGAWPFSPVVLSDRDDRLPREFTPLAG